MSLGLWLTCLERKKMEWGRWCCSRSNASLLHGMASWAANEHQLQHLPALCSRADWNRSVSHTVGGDGQVVVVPTNAILIPLITWIVMQPTLLHLISGKFQIVKVLEYTQICPHSSKKKDPINWESQLLFAAAWWKGTGKMKSDLLEMDSTRPVGNGH